MRILVTGAAGFIGSNFVHYAASARPDWRVTALDALTYAGNLENISSLLGGDKIEFVKADICDQQGMQKLFADKKFDKIFHFAAESHVDRSIHGAGAFVRTNVLGTQNLLDAAQVSKAGRFVHISTDEVYGSLGPTGAFTETTPLDPSSPYSASKASSDLMVLAANKTHGMDAVVTRCTNNYGPYQFPEKLIPLFITNALEDRQLPLYGDGMNVRSWLHVVDHCEALVLVGEQGRSGEVYNIGGSSDAEIPNRKVTAAILGILGKPDSLIKMVADRPGHDRRYAVDTSKIRSELGWKPRIAFKEGIERTVQWYLDNREWWQKVKTGEYLKFYEQNYANRH